MKRFDRLDLLPEGQDMVAGIDMTGGFYRLFQTSAPFPGCAFLLCLRGSCRVKIHLTCCDLKEGSMAIIFPGVFFQIQEQSKDCRFIFVGFSKKLIEGAKLFSYTVEYTPYIFERPVIEMKKDVYELFRDSIRLLIRRRKIKEEMSGMQISLIYTQLLLSLGSVYKKRGEEEDSPRYNRNQEIVKELVRIIVQYYKTERNVSFYAEKLHLKDTHFETVHGLDAPGQHSSAYDLAVLSRAIIHGEPEFYHMYSEKSLTWNGITQQNRNGLLWDKTMNVDGLKTGHTSGAGFNLIASAVDGQRRLIAVVMGADSAKGREEEARKLLRWGQQNFTTVQILHRGKKVGTERIWYGDKENIDLGTEQEFWMVLPKAEIPHIKAKYTLDGKELTAPISAHQRVGEIELYDRDKQVAHWPLVTLESVGEGSMFSRLSDYFHHKA